MRLLITSIPTERIFAGSSIEVIGEHQSVDDLADAIGSIGYDVLTSLGRRFRRIYRGGMEPVAVSRPRRYGFESCCHGRGRDRRHHRLLSRESRVRGYGY